MPEFLAVALKTEHGMIGRAAFLSRIVTLASPLLFTVERQDN